MSNVLGIIIGVVIIIVGLVLLAVWWSMFVSVLQGIIPVLLILIGIAALVYFISEIKSKMEMDKEEASAPKEPRTE